MKYLEEFVEVKKSELHGLGIFATSDFSIGSKIMIIKGEVISEVECIRRENEENNVYIFWNNDSYIDVSKTDKIKYINHKCEFNCEVWENDSDSLLLVASTDIASGEELTIDYGYNEIYENCQCEYCKSKRV